MSSQPQPSHSLFDSLQAQKRKDDPASIARRQSMSEQRPAPGFIGKMWNKYVSFILDLVFACCGKIPANTVTLLSVIQLGARQGVNTQPDLAGKKNFKKKTWDMQTTVRVQSD